jgi:DNA-binding NtrC family response regulator
MVKSVVDIIDGGCSLRRRNIAIRAEKAIIKLGLSLDDYKVRDFEGVDEWQITNQKEKPFDKHVVYLHAPNQSRFDLIVDHLFRRERESPDTTTLVTYTGGLTTPRHRKGAPGKTTWWDHYTHVLGIRDIGNRPQATEVGTSKPPVQEVLRRAFRRTAPKVVHENGAHETHAFEDEGLSGPDLRHLIINAVDPLRSAALRALDLGGEIHDFEVLWGKLRERLAPFENELPFWVVQTLDSLGNTIPKALESEPTSRSALTTLALDLGRIAGYAESVSQPETDWRELTKVLAESIGDIKPKVLWIDDEDAWFIAFRDLFNNCGFDLTFSDEISRWVERPGAAEGYDALLLDIGLEGYGQEVAEKVTAAGLRAFDTISDENAGIGLLQLFDKEITYPPPIFILSARESPLLVNACTSFGASGYIVKGKSDYMVLLTSLLREIRHRQQVRDITRHPRNPRLVVGENDDPLSDVFLRIDKIVRRGTPGPIHLVGEPGVGKEELAQEIHLRSNRDGDFHVADCSSIPHSLIERELFGCRKGAFTDAKEDVAGLFEVANGGTLFIDEVDKVGPALQNKLLGPLERRTIKRLGETRDRSIDVLVVMASNDDPHRAAIEGRFSEQLVSRITFKIAVPSLQRRWRSVGKLASGICHRLCEEKGWRRVSLAEDAVLWLEEHAKLNKFGGVYGNVRGLRRLLINTLTYFPDDPVIRHYHLQEVWYDDGGQILPPQQEEVFSKVGDTLAQYLAKVDRADLSILEDRIRAELFRSLRLSKSREDLGKLFNMSPENLRQHLKKLRDRGLLPPTV